MRYYWCVNCGYHGDFKFNRQKSIKCQICDYDELTELDKEEWDEQGRERNARQNQETFYKRYKKKS